MDLFSLMRGFLRVAERGSFSAAARELNLGQPTLSRQVAELEERLGARLLHRSTTGLSLTEDGVVFAEEARGALDATEAAMAAVGARHGEVRGLVRIGSGVAFGRLHVVPRLPALLRRYPGLTVELVVSDGFADLVEHGLDVSIRVGELTDQGLVARRIGLTRRALVASPGYLAERGALAHPTELAGHDCLLFTGLATGDDWPFDGPDGELRIRVAGRFRANSSEAVREAALAGLGIGLSPVWLFCAELADGRLVQLLPEWTPRSLPIHAVYSSRRHQPPRVRAVIDHLAAEFRLEPTLSDGGATPAG